MALSGLLAGATEVLRAAGIDDARREALALAVHVLDVARESMLARPGQDVAPDRAERFRAAVARRAAREPFARIAGRREFWSLDFVLSPDTLVPRPDTETLVEAVLARVPDRAAPLRILDLGTGTGCVLLALLSELANARGLGIDIAHGAVRTAAENARRLGLDARAGFRLGNWCDGLDGRFDIVVANPPYVAAGERDGLMAEVRDHDPPLALFAGADGLNAFRAIVPGLVRVLAPGGMAALECGAGQAPKVAEMLASAGFAAVATVRDGAGRERVVTASKLGPAARYGA